MDRSTGAVPVQARQIERLRHNPLSGKGGIPVDQDREDPIMGLPPIRPTGGELVLAGARHPLHHRIDELEVARIGRQAKADLPLPDLPRPGRSLVVLDVPLVRREVGVHRALERREDPLTEISNDVGQNGQPATVGHPEHHLIDSTLGRPDDQLVEHGDDRLPPFDGEPLLSEKLGVQKLLELFGGNQLLQQLPLDLPREGRRILLDLLTNPPLLLLARNVTALDPHLATVESNEHAPDFTERGIVLPPQSVGEEDPVEIPDREPVGLDLELGVGVHWNHAEWIRIRDQMSPHPIGVDPLEEADLLLNLLPLPIDSGKERIDVRRPAKRPVGNTQIGKDIIVEVVPPQQQLVEVGEKES